MANKVSSLSIIRILGGFRGDQFAYIRTAYPADGRVCDNRFDYCGSIPSTDFGGVVEHYGAPLLRQSLHYFIMSGWAKLTQLNWQSKAGANRSRNASCREDHGSMLRWDDENGTDRFFEYEINGAGLVEAEHTALNARDTGSNLAEVCDAHATLPRAHCSVAEVSGRTNRTASSTSRAYMSVTL